MLIQAPVDNGSALKSAPFTTAAIVGVGGVTAAGMTQSVTGIVNGLFPAPVAPMMTAAL
jgi:hypothetical protein